MIQQSDEAIRDMGTRALRKSEADDMAPENWESLGVWKAILWFQGRRPDPLVAGEVDE